MNPKLVYEKIHFKLSGVDEENHVIRGTFSTANEDRQGEIVDQNGWKLEEFMANPVILFAHDHMQPAVAKCIELVKDAEGNLAGAIQFAYDEYDFAATLFRLYAGQYMRAFSVGFMNDVTEYDQANDTVTLRENTLYEISCVNVPANAMALAYSKGVNTEPLEALQKKRASEHTLETISTKIDSARAAIDTLQKAVEVAKATAAVVVTPKGAEPRRVPIELVNKAIRELVKVKAQKI